MITTRQIKGWFYLLLICSSINSMIVVASEVAGSKFIIHGAGAEIQQNIEAHLAIEKGVLPFSVLGFPRSPEYILKKTRMALSAMGYYHPNLSLQGDHREWTLNVDPGQPVLWVQAQISVEGALGEIEEYSQLIATPPFHPGKVMNHGVYAQFKAKLQSLALSFGFFDAEFSVSELVVDQSALTAKVHWVIQSGERYRLGAINLLGSGFSKAFLSRYLFVSAGQVYNQADIFKTQQSLNRSGYFNYVSISQVQNKADKTLALNISLTDIEKYELKTSIGYGTDSGAKFGVSWQDRRFNEQGHKYSFAFNLSQLESSASAQYRVPLEGRKNEWINRVSYRLRDDELAATSLTTYDAIYLLHHNDYWSSQWGLTLASEQVSQNSVIQSTLNYLVPSVQLEYYSVTDPFSAQAGWRWQQEFRFGNQGFSDPGFSFLQLEEKVKKIWQVSDQWRLLFRGQLAYTDMDDAEFNHQMPTSYRYFAGGDISVRGYDYQSLSPKDADGIVLGGKHLLTASLEVDRRFADDYRWALFYDQGNAFNDWNHVELKSSVGLGFRWVTPIGAIRIDYARALDFPNEWRWHITIGPDL